jgi:hypothetical protein
MILLRVSNNHSITINTTEGQRLEVQLNMVKLRMLRVRTGMLAVSRAKEPLKTFIKDEESK